MLFGDHPLFDLQAQAAIASGWPTLHVFGASESDVLEAREIAIRILGPLPQSDTIEPWDPADPEDQWEVRIDLPDLEAADWGQLRDALQAHGLIALVPGVSPGVRACEDRGFRYSEGLTAHGVTADMWLEPDGVWSPDLARASGADDDLNDLERELAAAVRRVSPELVFRSDRGPDTISAVVHRSTGRFGIRIHFSEDEPDLRQPILEAVVGVIAARSEHRVRLAPDIVWDTPLLGFEIGLWFLAPSVSTLPGDAPAVSSSWEGDLTDGVEVQVIPRDLSEHAEIAQAVASLAETEGLPLTGALPRWVRRPHGWQFCPVWTAPSGADLSALRGIYADVRIVPGQPTGLGEAWLTSDVSWMPADFRCFVRIRDGLSDRDHRVAVVDRRRTPRDAEIEVQAFAALAVSDAAGVIPLGPGSPARAVADGSGRPGLEFAFDRKSFTAEPLYRALRALGAIHGDDLSAWALWAHRSDRTLVQIWYRGTYGDLADRSWI